MAVAAVVLWRVEVGVAVVVLVVVAVAVVAVAVVLSTAAAVVVVVVVVVVVAAVLEAVAALVLLAVSPVGASPLPFTGGEVAGSVEEEGGGCGNRARMASLQAQS